MKTLLKSILSLLFLLNLSCNSTEKSKNVESDIVSKTTNTQVNEFAIVIHGGAGTILKKNMTKQNEAAYKAKLEEAVMVGYNILKEGGSSLDAVQKTINILEDSPLFNAGKGAVFTNEETIELDASIMDGKTLNAGACAAITSVKNPINLARKIMDVSPHVMMTGQGAEKYAKEQQLEIVDPNYFKTEKQLKSLKRIKEKETNKEKQIAFYDAEIKNSKFGTVGCVALDKNGNLAAGTSTGGMTNKRFGRVGDVPIIGAGTYANNTTCAVSGTGWGEFFIRATVAHDISALVEYKGLSLKDAAKEVIQKKVPDLGGNGGIIAIDKYGNIVMDFNTAGMYRASVNDKGEVYVGIYNQ
ncbi:isoaspartyl peptidase/L-asparaginase family protein [Mesoflavibacter profundi]|uniref:isoaspartyl peptidase/L-asparaginase family protein n=1 Tax=Mesoflavibacter profundi TaxID=2708110 RepID=UPI003511B7EF